MLRDIAAFARKIIEFYNTRGVECLVVNEHSNLLVVLCLDDKTHEFRYNLNALAGAHIKPSYRTLASEYDELIAAPASFPPARHAAHNEEFA